MEEFLVGELVVGNVVGRYGLVVVVVSFVWVFFVYVDVCGLLVG